MPIPVCRKSGRVLSLENIPNDSVEVHQAATRNFARNKEGVVPNNEGVVEVAYSSQRTSASHAYGNASRQEIGPVSALAHKSSTSQTELPRTLSQVQIPEHNQDHEDARYDNVGEVAPQNQETIRNDPTSLPIRMYATKKPGNFVNNTDELEEKIAACASEKASPPYDTTDSSTEGKDNRSRNGKKYRVKDVDPVKTLSFPAKLHAILSQKLYNDLISWLPHGRSWRVHKPKAFEKHVIPHFFVQCKYSSFIRQANGWGFRRITRGRDRNSYYHKFFLRGSLPLCQKMFRPGTFKKPNVDPENEPDFYRMSELDPLPEVNVVESHHVVKEALSAQEKRDEEFTKSQALICHKSQPSYDPSKKFGQTELEKNRQKLFDIQQRQDHKAFAEAAATTQSAHVNLNFSKVSLPKLDLLNKSYEMIRANSNSSEISSEKVASKNSSSESNLNQESKIPEQETRKIPEQETKNVTSDNNSEIPQKSDQSRHLQDLLDISQYFRSRRGEYESVIINNRLVVRSREDAEINED